MITIGSRGSMLALWQANHVQAQLHTRGIEARIEVSHTTGDKITDVPLAKLGAQTSTKGLFTKELEDGAGELMNIVYGTAKSALNEKGYAMQKALPSVIRGTNVSLRHVGSGTTLVLPFKTAAGEFEIEIGMEISSQKKVA